MRCCTALHVLGCHSPASLYIVLQETLWCVELVPRSQYCQTHSSVTAWSRTFSIDAVVPPDRVGVARKLKLQLGVTLNQSSPARPATASSST